MLIDFILIVLFLGAYWYWSNGQLAKERALDAVKGRCLCLGVQLLDDYVALESIRLRRDNAGRVCFSRSYSFEFSSTGNERYNGKCKMSGLTVEAIQMEPYRIDESRIN